MKLRLLVTALAVVLAATWVASPAPTAEAANSCLPQTIPAALNARPVVLVHGWNGSPQSWDATVTALANDPYRAARRYRLLRFDYSSYASQWPSVPEISTCLADYLVEVAARYRASGGDGKVLAVGHSMGGIALRFASNLSSSGTPVASVLAGVVTIGTPHQGSPWGGTIPAQYLQDREVDALREVVPAEDSSAATCLLTQEQREATCEEPPFFPAGIPVTTLGTQIVVTRDIFGFATGPQFTLFGDGIVPASSAIGYPGSGPVNPSGDRSKVPRTDLTAFTERCDYLSSGLPSLWIGPYAQLGVDYVASEALLRGQGSLALAQLTLAVKDKPCFHSNLTSEDRIVADTYRALVAFEKKLARAGNQQVQLAPGYYTFAHHRDSSDSREYPEECDFYTFLRVTSVDNWMFAYTNCQYGDWIPQLDRVSFVRQYEGPLNDRSEPSDVILVASCDDVSQTSSGVIDWRASIEWNGSVTTPALGASPFVERLLLGPTRGPEPHDGLIAGASMSGVMATVESDWAENCGTRAG